MHIHLFDMINAVPPLPCLCSSFRRSARALTQVYEEAFRPVGLRGSQFSILMVLDRMGELLQGQLGTALAMDSTTLTRTLAIMRRQGWITERPGTDRRERWLNLSNGGKAQLKRALPVWDKVQTRLKRQMGAETWDSVLGMANQLAQQVAK